MMKSQEITEIINICLDAVHKSKVGPVIHEGSFKQAIGCNMTGEKIIINATVQNQAAFQCFLTVLTHFLPNVSVVNHVDPNDNWKRQ